jgi:hypothetical protein
MFRSRPAGRRCSVRHGEIAVDANTRKKMLAEMERNAKLPPHLRSYDPSLMEAAREELREPVAPTKGALSQFNRHPVVWTFVLILVIGLLMGAFGIGRTQLSSGAQRDWCSANFDAVESTKQNLHISFDQACDSLYGNRP